jgi:hypothetical protein
MSVQTLDFSAPLNPAFGNAASDDTIPVASGERVFLWVKNGGGSGTNVSMISQVANANVPGVGAVAIANRLFNVPAGGERLIGPIPNGFVGSNGLAVVSYSATASVTRCAIAAPLPA